MTPTEEATFTALWAEGLTTAAIAQQLGIPVGTVKSRAHTLAHAGKLTPRPRGGVYPRQQGKARQHQTPVQSRADPPLEGIHPPVHTLHRVQAQLYALHGAEHTELTSEDLKSERWNIYMPRWLRRLIEVEAATTRLSPSQVLQDVVKAWVEQRQQGAGEGP